MKIFKRVTLGRKEIQVVYVQTKDLVYLYQNNLLLPDYIMNRVSEVGINILSGMGQEQFAMFWGDKAIDYFKNERAVIDYGEYRYLGDMEIKEKSQVILHEGRRRKAEIKRAKAKGEAMHMLKSIHKIYWYNKKQIELERIADINEEAAIRLIKKR